MSLAVDCGLAFQLTNILRDLVEDARHGRCYLPNEDLVRFGVTCDDLAEPTLSAKVRELLRWESARARCYFASARQLIPLCHPQGRPILDSMLRTYGALLAKVEASGFRYDRRARLTRGRKIAIVLGALLRHAVRQVLHRDGARKK